MKTSLETNHHNNVIIDAIASQITSLTIVYSTVHSGTNHRKHQSSASLVFVRGIHRWTVNSPHKWPVTRKTFPFDDVIMLWLFISMAPVALVSDLEWTIYHDDEPSCTPCKIHITLTSVVLATASMRGMRRRKVSETCMATDIKCIAGTIINLLIGVNDFIHLNLDIFEICK